MAYLSDYTAGTVTSTGNVITGDGTGWSAAGFREGDIFIAEGWWAIVASVDGNTQLTLVDWAGPVLSDAAYRMRYMSDGSRASAQARQLIDLLGSSGNLEALGGLTGLPDTVPYFTGPGTMGLLTRQDLTQGVRYDVQVDEIPDRDAYDGEAVGFSVLVSNVGDGRSAIYSREGAVGNWSDPAYITGPVGPMPNIEVGDTSTLAPGSDATVTANPIPGGIELDFGIPAGAGFYFEGTYNLANTYNTDDVVAHNGSSFIALQLVPPGNSPSSAFPPVDNAYWRVLAARGADGLGTGDVVGPSGAVDNTLSLFDGTTGKLIKTGPILTDTGADLAGAVDAAAARAVLEAGEVGENVFKSADRIEFLTASTLAVPRNIASPVSANAVVSQSDTLYSNQWTETPGASGWLIVNVITPTITSQQFISATNNRRWSRVQVTGTWGGWREVVQGSNFIVQAKKTTNQALGSGPGEAIVWDTAEISEVAGVLTGGAPDAFIMPAGFTRVRFRCGVVFSANATGNRQVYIEKNGSEYPYGYISDKRLAASSGSTSITASSPWMQYSPGDYFQLFAHQDSGTTLDISGLGPTWWEAEFAYV